jgi:hypothetical protein
LDVKTGKVQGKTAERHTSSEFIAFLSEAVKRARWANEIYIVLDNLSAHKTKAVEQFLAEHPKVHFHFTPTYSSCLNQVELWFAKSRAICSLAASSPPSPIWLARSASTSAPTPKLQVPSTGAYPDNDPTERTTEERTDQHRAVKLFASGYVFAPS